MVATKFRLYSTTSAAGVAIAATLAPDLITPAPAVNIAWDHDPLKSGSFDLAEPDGRGSVAETGAGGIVIQDLGVPEGGGVITISGDHSAGEWMKRSTVGLFRTAYETVGAEYYLTDGIVHVWLIQWQRKPSGFNAWLNLRWAQRGRLEYSYKFQFLIKRTVLR